MTHGVPSPARRPTRIFRRSDAGDKAIGWCRIISRSSGVAPCVTVLRFLRAGDGDGIEPESAARQV
jgi:hypothetical protein